MWSRATEDDTHFRRASGVILGSFYGHGTRDMSDVLVFSLFREKECLTGQSP